MGKPSTSGSSFSIAAPSRLKLFVIEGPCQGQMFDSINSTCLHLTVGRVKKAKIYLKDGAISEKHAEFAWDGHVGAWTLRDTGSSNGTRVNGAQLQPFRAHLLKHGEHIALGTETIATVEFMEQTLQDVTMEMLLRAHFESRCQALEERANRTAHEMVQHCHEALDALLALPVEM